jgi:hypothetical protein
MPVEIYEGYYLGTVYNGNKNKNRNMGKLTYVYSQANIGPSIAEHR